MDNAQKLLPAGASAYSAGGAYSAPPDPLAVKKGADSRQRREGKMRRLEVSPPGR